MEKRKKKKKEEREGGIRADRGADRDCTRKRVGRAWRGGRWFVTRGTGKREGRDSDWTSGDREIRRKTIFGQGRIELNDERFRKL